jgi:hypothetical protein
VDEPGAFTKAMLSHHSLNGKKTYYKKMPYTPIQFPRNKKIQVYTIDPLNCEDIDDGVSFNIDSIGIHITYVGHHMVNYKLSNYCTLYPQICSNIHMLPEKYAKDDFSLVSGKWRNVISLYLKTDGNMEWVLEQVRIRKNLSYEEGNEKFRDILQEYHEYLDNFIHVNDGDNNEKYTTKTLIEKCAIIYNCYAMRKILEGNQIPIVREHSKTENRAFYSYALPGREYKHEDIGLTNYGHITSPIRRAVDIYNQCKLASALNPGLVPPDFIQNEINIQELNEWIISSKKFATQCELYGLFSKEDLPDQIMSKIVTLENNAICVEFILGDKKKRRYIPALPYYLETNWEYDPLKCYYKHSNGTKRNVNIGEYLVLKVIRDRNPYPRVMLVPAFLLALQGGGLFRSLHIEENQSLPYLPP